MLPGPAVSYDSPMMDARGGNRQGAQQSHQRTPTQFVSLSQILHGKFNMIPEPKITG